MGAILFDLGETLIHLDQGDKRRVEEDRFEAVQRYLSNKGYRLTADILRKAYSRSIEALSDDPEEEVHIQSIFAEVLNGLQVDVASVELGELERVFYQGEVEAWMLFPDAIPCLEYALKAGFKLGLVSNARSDWAVREILKRLGLDRYFEAVVTSAQVGLRKPAPEPFIKALEILGEVPGGAAFIGDTFSADIVGAKRIGMRAIYLNRGYDPTPMDCGVTPDYIVRDLMGAVEVIRILSQIIKARG
ncbi:MAG: HAD family hydrolase [Candidatus Bathyarchaeia archaeon]